MALHGKGTKRGGMSAGAGSGMGRMEKAGHMMPAMHKQMAKGKMSKSVHNKDVGFRFEHDALASMANRVLFEKAVQAGQEPKPTKTETAFLESRDYDVLSREARARARKARKIE